MNGKTRPDPMPLKWAAGLRHNVVNKDGRAGDMVLFNANRVQAAVGYLQDKIKENIKDGEARKAALAAVDEAFPELMPA